MYYATFTPKMKRIKNTNRHVKSSKRPIQMALGKHFCEHELAFGGTLLKGNNPKNKRPLDSKLPSHLVLRSSLAKGAKSFRHSKNLREIEKIVRKTAEKYGVRIYEFANAGDHLHILLRLLKRFLWKAFICELTGRIANFIRGFGPMMGKFWDYRPFTRVVQGWGRSYRIVKDYVVLNTLEAVGLLSRRDQNWKDIFIRSG